METAEAEECKDGQTGCRPEVRHGVCTWGCLHTKRVLGGMDDDVYCMRTMISFCTSWPNDPNSYSRVSRGDRLVTGPWVPADRWDHARHVNTLRNAGE